MLTRLFLIASIFATTTTPLFAAETVLGCYSNTYSKQHLSKHKGQSITFMKMKLYKDDSAEGLNADMYAEVTVKLRGNNKQTWSEVADCAGKPGAWKCGIECDGGGFELADDANGLTLINTRGFRVALDGCGENSVTIESTPGNRLFRLSKAKLSACK
jgi:hypothetical protein